MSRYADFASASPRCQQILQTIELTSQQGIFIYDLTFLQQELEASLFAAVQRRDELQRSATGEVLTLPSTSFVRSANGKKPRDFKAERERRRKAFAGQMTRKRRRKKPKKPKEVRPAIVDETKLSNVEQFWLDVVEERRETFDEENLRLDRQIDRHRRRVSAAFSRRNSGENPLERNDSFGEGVSPSGTSTFARRSAERIFPRTGKNPPQKIFLAQDDRTRQNERFANDRRKRSGDASS